MKQLRYIIVLICLVFIVGCQFHKAPTGIYFPHGWGEPPQIQTKDYVMLPDGYGHGSSTLKHWIKLNKQRDDINIALNKLPTGLGGLALP